MWLESVAWEGLHVCPVKLAFGFLVTFLEGTKNADLQAFATYLRQPLIWIVETFAGYRNPLKTPLVLLNASILSRSLKHVVWGLSMLFVLNGLGCGDLRIISHDGIVIVLRYLNNIFRPDTFLSLNDRLLQQLVKVLLHLVGRSDGALPIGLPNLVELLPQLVLTGQITMNVPLGIPRHLPWLLLLLMIVIIVVANFNLLG